MNQITKILEELYTIEPSLAEKEAELEKIIASMLQIKPEITVDSDFRNALKSQLSQDILERKMKMYSQRTHFTFFQKFSYFVGAAGVACFGFVLLKQNIVDHAIAPALETLKVQEHMGEKSFSQEVVLTETALKEQGEKMQKTVGTKQTIENSEIKPEKGAVRMTLDTQVSPENSSTSTDKTTINNSSSEVSSAGGSNGNNQDTAVSSDMIVSDSMVGAPMGLMKASPDIAEYIQDVYEYSFSEELNLDFSEISGDIFKKPSQEVMYFQKQELSLETNTKNILQVALKGGKDGYVTQPESQKKREVKVVLKNPKLAYTIVYMYAGGVSKEYFAPCVIFEVDKKLSDKNYYGTEIVVPLVKEIYSYDVHGNIIGLSQE